MALVKKKNLKKRAAHYFVRKNLKILFAALGVIMIWRSIWWLLDLYWIPGNPTTDYIASLLFGILILLLDDWLLEELEEK